MASSTAPEAKRRLLALFRASPSLTGVGIEWNAPTEAEDIPRSGEMVHLGDVALTGSWKQLGGGLRDEEYTIALTVFVEHDGDNMQATEERSWSILDALQSAITTDRMLAGLLMLPAEILSATQRAGIAGQDKTGSRIDATVRCVARFSPT